MLAYNNSIMSIHKDRELGIRTSPAFRATLTTIKDIGDFTVTDTVYLGLAFLWAFLETQRDRPRKQSFLVYFKSRICQGAEHLGLLETEKVPLFLQQALEGERVKTLAHGVTKLARRAVLLSYIAGIIDGEGSIYITKRPQRKEIGMRSPYYRAGVEVKNTDERMINFLLTHLGGHKSIQLRKTNRQRNVYTWALVDKRVGKVLKELYPYLVCKKEQADIVFRFRSSFHSYGTEKNALPTEIVSLREGYYQELKKLHGIYSGRANIDE